MNEKTQDASSKTQDPMEKYHGVKTKIPIEDIVSTADRDQGDVKSLANSIIQVGMLQPILLRGIEGGKYEVVDGRRRFAACLSLGWKTLAQQDYTLAPEAGDAQVMAHVANVERKDLTPAEEVRQLAALAETHSVERLAEMFGRTPGWIARRIRIKTLIPEWMKVMDDPEHSGAWPLDKLALIARQSEDTQKSLLYLYPELHSVKHIEQAIAKLNHRISAAHFDTAGCANCPNNTATASLLFDDCAERATCTDQTCWIKKSVAAVKAVLKREKLIPIRGDGDTYGRKDREYADSIDADDKWHFAEVRPPKKGETANAIFVSGNQIGRRVVAVKLAESRGQGEQVPEVKKERTVKEMVEELARKREKRALVLLLEYLRKEYSAAAWMAKIPKEEELGDLFMVLRLYGMSGDKRNEYGCSLEPEDIQETGIEEVRQHAYFQALEQIKRSLGVETVKTMKYMSQVARAGIAKLLRIEDKAKDFHDQAMVEIKEPKSLTEARAREKAAKAAKRKKTDGTDKTDKADKTDKTDKTVGTDKTRGAR